MKQTFSAVSSVALITLMTVLVITMWASREVTPEPEVTTAPSITETVEPTGTVYETEPTVDILVDNVDNPVEETVVCEPLYTPEELEILALIIYQEAGADRCSDDTRLKVGSVFLNRVNSPLFPDTFLEVATQERQYGSLYWTGIRWPDRAKSALELHAVERAYRLAEELLVNGSILPDNVIWQAEFRQGNGVYCYQDEMYFCYSEVNK